MPKSKKTTPARASARSVAASRRRQKRRADLLKKDARRCGCGQKLWRYWNHCPKCARARVWRDSDKVTHAECGKCGWIVSNSFSYCPWCRKDIYEEGYSSEVPLRAPRGFRRDGKCDGGCGGGVQYPMCWCPWCSRKQRWNEDALFEGSCPHCARGVDDSMAFCPWCGKDATGQDLIPRTLRRVRRLLVVSQVKQWPYRVLIRPGVSGVDPTYPDTIEIDRAYVSVKERRRRGGIPWKLLVGLVLHELGHSFLYRHWKFARSARFKRAFGRVDKAYRVRDDFFVDFDRRRVATSMVDYVSTYAAKHPEEDFAETFRFYVTRRGRLRELFAEFGKMRKGVIVYEKFLVLHDFIRELRGFGAFTRRS